MLGKKIVMELTVDHNCASPFAMIDHINFPKYLRSHPSQISCSRLNIWLK